MVRFWIWIWFGLIWECESTPTERQICQVMSIPWSEGKHIANCGFSCFPGNARPRYGIKTLICGMLFPGPIVFWCLLVLKIALLKKKLDTWVYTMQINVHTIDFYPLRMFPFCSQERLETHCCLHRSGLPFVASRLQGLPSDFQKKWRSWIWRIFPENSTHQEDVW